MTDGYVVVQPEQPVRLDQYEICTALSDPHTQFRWRLDGQDWQITHFSRQVHLPAGWWPAGDLFEVSARWSDNPGTILVRLATRP